MARNVNFLNTIQTAGGLATELFTGDTELAETVELAAALGPRLIKALGAGRSAARAYRLRKGWMPNDNAKNTAYQKAYWEMISTSIAALEQPTLADEAEIYIDEIVEEYNNNKKKKDPELGKEDIHAALKQAQKLMEDPALQKEFEDSLKRIIEQEKDNANILQPIGLLDPAWEGIEEHPNGKQLIIYYSLDHKNDKVDRAIESYRINGKTTESPRRITPEEHFKLLMGLKDLDKRNRFVFIEAPEGQKAYVNFIALDNITGVAGFCDMPNEEGAVLGIDGTSFEKAKNNSDKYTIIHEFGHLFGMPHTHSPFYENIARDPLTNDKNNLNFSVMAYYKNHYEAQGAMGGYTEVKKFGYPEAQIADYKFLDHYYKQYEGIPREPLIHVIPDYKENNKFSGTFHLLEGDTVKVEALESGIFNFFEQLNEPSQVGQGKFWFYGPHQNLTVKVEGGNHYLNFREDTNLEVEEGDHIIQTGDGNYMDLGTGSEDIILPKEAGAIISIKDFDPLKDEIMFPSSVTRWKAKPLDKKNRQKGSVITLYNGSDITHEVILHGVNHQLINENNVKEHDPSRIADLLIAKRNFIEIEKHGNGYIDGFEPAKHALQLNLPETDYKLMYRYEAEEGGKVKLWFSGKPPKGSLNKKMLPEPDLIVDEQFFYPDTFKLYHNNIQLKGYGRTKNQDGEIVLHERTDASADVAYTYSDYRLRKQDASNPSPSFNLSEADAVITGKDKMHIHIARENKNPAPMSVAYIHTGGTGAMEVTFQPESSKFAALSKLRIAKDRLVTQSTHVKQVKVGDKTALIFEYEPDDDSKAPRRHYLLIDEVEGPMKHLKLVNYSQPVDVSEVQEKDLHVDIQIDLAKLTFSATQTKERVLQQFPELEKEKAAARDR
jgi:hypothetical protein